MAQAKRIGVQFSTLESTSKKLADYSADYTKIYQEMFSAVEAMGGNWTGVDYQAFKTQLDGFLEDLQNMAKKLMLASETLAKQNKQYVDRQQHLVENARKLRN